MTSLLGEWQIVRYRDEHGLVPPVAGTRPTITFAPDNRILVVTGCNTVHSTWTLEGADLTLSAPFRTLMYCAEPAGVMEQETALANALERCVAVEVAAERLTLLSARREVMIEAEYDASAAGEARPA